RHPSTWLSPLDKRRLGGGKTIRDFDGDAHEPHLRTTLLLTHRNLRLCVVSGLQPQISPYLAVAVEHRTPRGRILQTSVATDHGGDQGIVLPRESGEVDIRDPHEVTVVLDRKAQLPPPVNDVARNRLAELVGDVDEPAIVGDDSGLRALRVDPVDRSEEHTSELPSREKLV